MADENDLAAAETDDLRATLTAAFDNPSPEPAAESVEPSAEETSARDDRARDELGRFAPKGDEAPARAAKAEPVEQAQQTQETAPAASEAQQQAIKPPPGWSIAAKAEFEKLSPAVREAVVKREAEVNNGFAKLAEYKPLEPFVEMAKQGGTTLDKALASYTGIEKMLRANPAQGIAQIAQNLGMHPVQLAQQVLAAYGQPSAQTGQQVQPQIDPSVQAVIQQQLMPLQRTVQQLTAERQAQTTAQVEASIQSFFNDPANKFAENLQEDMVPFISQRRSSNPSESYADTLKWAYDKASWANGETRAVLINEQNAQRAAADKAKADQARAAARSITGSPTYGISVGEGAPADDLRSEIARQFAAMSGRI